MEKNGYFGKARTFVKMAKNELQEAEENNNKVSAQQASAKALFGLQAVLRGILMEEGVET